MFLNQKIAVHKNFNKNKKIQEALPVLGETRKKSSMQKITSNSLQMFIGSALKKVNKIREHKYLKIAQDELVVPKEYEMIRWFVLPSEAKKFVQMEETKSIEIPVRKHLVNSQSYMRIQEKKPKNAYHFLNDSENSKKINRIFCGRSQKAILASEQKLDNRPKWILSSQHRKGFKLPPIE